MGVVHIDFSQQPFMSKMLSNVSMWFLVEPIEPKEYGELLVEVKFPSSIQRMRSSKTAPVPKTKKKEEKGKKIGRKQRERERGASYGKSATSVKLGPMTSLVDDIEVLQVATPDQFTRFGMSVAKRVQNAESNDSVNTVLAMQHVWMNATDLTRKVAMSVAESLSKISTFAFHCYVMFACSCKNYLKQQ